MVVFSMLGLVFVLSGLYIIFKSSKWSLKDRLITYTPTSKVQSIAMGLVELHGTARPYEKKRAKTPFTGLDCIWCGWVIEKEYTDLNGRKRKHVLGRGEIPCLFLLADDTGEVLVYSKGANVDAKYSRTSRGCLNDDMKDFVKKHANHWRDTLMGIFSISASDMVFTEYFLAPYEKTYVLGTARNNPLIKGVTTEKNEDGIIISKGRDIFYISTKPIDQIHLQASWGIKSYLVFGTFLVVCGALLILI